MLFGPFALAVQVLHAVAVGPFSSMEGYLESFQYRADTCEDSRSIMR